MPCVHSTSIRSVLTQRARSLPPFVSWDLTKSVVCIFIYIYIGIFIYIYIYIYVRIAFAIIGILIHIYVYVRIAFVQIGLENVHIYIYI